MLPRLAAPLLLIGAAEDKDPAPAVIEDLRMRLDTAGKHVQARVFDGAGHAFFDDRLAAYRQPAAFELWKVAITFLATHLKAGHGNPET
jgi:carboxymethylenebutenolidase